MQFDMEKVAGNVDKGWHGRTHPEKGWIWPPVFHTVFHIRIRICQPFWKAFLKGEHAEDTDFQEQWQIFGF